MKKVIALVPMSFNDGSPVPQKIFSTFENELLRIAGGYSKDGLVEGGWRDEEIDYFDTSRRYIIITEKVEEIKKLVADIGKQLGQKTMYFETLEANVEFIRTE
jgi:predicted hydrocarbon binding protein